MGVFYLKTGEIARAIKYLEESRKINHASPKLYQALGAAYSALGDAEKMAENCQTAETKFGEALAKNPKDLDSLTSLGYVLHLLGRVDEAEEIFARAIRYYSNDPFLYEDLADTYRKLGLDAKADLCFAKAQELRREK